MFDFLKGKSSVLGFNMFRFPQRDKLKNHLVRAPVDRCEKKKRTQHKCTMSNTHSRDDNKLENKDRCFSLVHVTLCVTFLYFNYFLFNFTFPLKCQEHRPVSKGVICFRVFGAHLLLSGKRFPS